MEIRNTARRIGSWIAMMAVAVMMAATQVSSAVTGTVNSPSFEYPRQVIGDAEASLKSGLAAGDYPAVVKAVLNKSAGMMAINADSISACVEFISSVTSQVDSEPARAMLNLVQMSFLNDYYSSDSYNLDNRVVPDGELSPDIRQWSGKQIRDSINGLASRVLDVAVPLLNTDIGTYSDVIKTDKLTRVYFPTLLDFAVYNIVETAKTWRDSRITIPEKLWFTPISPEMMDMLRLDAGRRLSLGALDKLIEMSADRRAPLAHATVERAEIASDGQISFIAALAGKYRELPADDEFSGDYLIAMGNLIMFLNDTGEDVPFDRQLFENYYRDVESNLKKFPAYPRIDKLQSIADCLKGAYCTTELNISILPGVPFFADVKSRNVSDGKLLFYHLSDDLYSTNWTKKLKTLQPDYTADFTVDNPTFLATVTRVKCEIPRPGRYAVKLQAGDCMVDRAQVVIVSDININVVTITGGSCRAYVLDAANGSPVAGAEVIGSRSYSSDEKLFTAVTDASGVVVLPEASKKLEKAYASKGENITWETYLPSVRIYRNNFDIIAANVTTALAVYHPGDSIEWGAYVYLKDKKHIEVLSGRKVVARLEDVNSRSVSCDTLVTDSWGRVSGKFAVPKETLTGNYSVCISSLDENTSNGRRSQKELGRCYVSVSDYKLPTFEVTDLVASMDKPSRGDVTVSGRAVSYAGFPISGADVSVKIDMAGYRGYWGRWNMNRLNTLAVFQAETGGDGRFEIVVPASLLSLVDSRKYCFAAGADVTSAAGETQSASIGFSVGYRYVIHADRQIVVDGDATQPFALNVIGLNERNLAYEGAVECRLLKDKNVVRKFEVNLPGPKLDMRDVKSGEYTLEISLPDTTLAAPEKVALTVYRKSDRVSPVEQEIWLPETLMKTDGRDKSVKVGFEASRAGLYLRVYANINGWSVKETSVKTVAGYNTLPIAIDDTTRTVTVRILGMADHKPIDKSVDIEVNRDNRSIKLKVESFRDRIVPGGQERWRFKVLNEHDAGVAAAVMVDMYNKALDKISQRGVLGFPTFNDIGPVEIRPEFRLGTASLYYQPSFNNYVLYSQSLQSPSFIITPRQFMREVLYRANATGRKMSAVSADLANVVREHKEEVVVESFSAAATADFTGAVVEEEIAVEGDNGAGGQSDADGNGSDFSYRDSEVALAMFRPMLNSDEDGNLDLTFTVPNANTTWRFNCVAFTRDLLNTMFDADVVAAKEVMVQPNLPRFVRAGDEIVIPATVMNNSAVKSRITTVTELFDPVDGKVLESTTEESVVGAGKSVVVKTVMKAPLDKAMIGYRVKSSTSGYSDGEQAMIPVLASVQPVIESETFYMSPDSTVYTTAVPSSSGNDRVILTFCENPAWSVVTALPGLRDSEPTTAVGASQAIFSAAVADGLMKSNQQIAVELRRWLESNREDSTLVSMLERNSDLKMFMLNVTPWVAAAENDTERMTRLALLFDRKAIDKVYDDAISTLGKLASDGGFKWFNQASKPSQWTTMAVLTNLGRLKEMGWLPSDKRLQKLIENAVVYIDRETVAEYRRYPKADYARYAFVRRYFKDIKMSTAAKAVNDAAVQQALVNWKKSPLYDKAYYGHILLSNGYPSTVKTILKSIGEFAEYQPLKGMWWPSLEGRYSSLSGSSLILNLYALSTPGCDEIDRIRQWLIGEKELQDWGSAITTTDVIASIISTSGKYFGPAGEVRIAVDGSELELPRFDKAVGRYNINLSQVAPEGGRMSIARMSQSPSWGSVMTFRTAGMTQIKPASTEGLSIEKKLYRIDNTDNGPVATETDTFSVGDLVRVELIITVDRALDYVAVNDERPACLEPVEQTPAPVFKDGVWFYRENRDAVTNIFINSLGHGVYRVSYDMRANNAGRFAGGIATIQSQYAPGMTAHSGGMEVTVKW